MPTSNPSLPNTAQSLNRWTKDFCETQATPFVVADIVSAAMQVVPFALADQALRPALTTHVKAWLRSQSVVAVPQGDGSFRHERHEQLTLPLATEALTYLHSRITDSARALRETARSILENSTDPAFAGMGVDDLLVAAQIDPATLAA